MSPGTLRDLGHKLTPLCALACECEKYLLHSLDDLPMASQKRNRVTEDVPRFSSEEARPGFIRSKPFKRFLACKASVCQDSGGRSN
ncbi:MAG: hypothetical protein Q9210_001297 [Variospora velana]